MSGDMAYVGIKSCGCLGAAIVDNPNRKRDVAREVAKCIRAGLALEKLPIETVRSMPWTCRAHSPASQVKE